MKRDQESQRSRESNRDRGGGGGKIDRIKKSMKKMQASGGKER